MSDHTEWGRIWRIVRWAHGPHDEWPRFEYQGADVFDIHHAKHFAALLQRSEPDAGWKILHAHGYYPPEEWVSDPWHSQAKNVARTQKPDGYQVMHPDVFIPPDYVEYPDPGNLPRGQVWHWSNPVVVAYLKTLSVEWVHPPTHHGAR